MWQDTTEGDSGTDEGVKLFVSADGKLQMTWRDTLDLEIFGGVASELEDFGGEVFEDSGNVDSGLGSDAHLVLGLGFEETLDTTAWELWNIPSQ